MSIENIWVRILFLLAAAGVGVCLADVDAIVYCLAEDLTGRYATSIKLMLLGSPVFSVLWFFRTHDVQSQLTQGEENRRQGELVAAFGWLAGATFAEKVLGLVELKRLRDLYPEFQERIDAATRMGINLSTTGEREGGLLEGLDLSGMDLRNANFSNVKIEGVIVKGTKIQGVKGLNEKTLAYLIGRGAVSEMEETLRRFT